MRFFTLGEILAGHRSKSVERTCASRDQCPSIKDGVEEDRGQGGEILPN